MNRKFGLKSVVALMLIASALTCVIVLAVVGTKLGYGTPLFDELKTYLAMRRDIESVYIGEYDSTAVNEAALRATVEALDDRWSYYMTPAEYDEYVNLSNNQYAGIGVVVVEDEETGGIRIRSVYTDSPAERAGLTDGDVIIAVDGADVTDMDYFDAINLIGGPIGQTVDFTVLGSDGATRHVTAEYDIVRTNPVSYKMLDGDVGYIRIANFDGSTGDAFVAAAEALVDDGAQSFVFDVRYNGGGRVSELVKMLDYLLPECEIFVAVDHTGAESVTWSDESSVTLPAVVLVNDYSFSAAEYFAAGLWEYDYAQVVGVQTTGKNRSQITLRLPDGGALHISSGEYLTPNRVSLTEQGGLTPDVELALTEEQDALLYVGKLDTADDDQLQKALEILNPA